MNAREPVDNRQWLSALLLACVCSVLFLRDALLPGRALVPHPPELFDVVMQEARDSGRFDAADTFRGNVGMTDKYLQSLCWDRVMQDRFRNGELPRWTNDIGGGAPFVPQMAQPWQPINALLLLLPSVQWYGWWWFVHQVLFGVFAYAFLRRLGCGHGAALLGLVAASLGLWTQCKLHHNVILTAALSLWPMLSAAHALVADGVRGRERLGWLGWLGLWAGLSWSTGFVVVALQATYLTLLATLLFTWQAPRGDRLRRLVPVAVGLGLGAMLAAANMIPILLAAATSARDVTWDAAKMQGLGLEWEHALAACWPDLLSWGADRFYAAAEGASPAYFTRVPLTQLLLLQPLRASDASGFQNWVETSFAIGLAPLALGLAALTDRARRPLAWGTAALALVSFGFATADQPFFGLARLVPGFAAGDLRRQLFSTAMLLVVLGALGADSVLRGGRRWPAVTLLAAVATASVAAVLWLATHGTDAAFARGLAQLFCLDADAPDVVRTGGSVDVLAQATLAAAAPGELAYNHAALATTAWRALLVAALALLALWRRRAWAVPLWLALTIAELLHAGRGPVQTVPADRVTQLPVVLQPVAQANATTTAPGDRPRLWRYTKPSLPVTALPGNIPGFLGLEDVSAYNPLPPARAEAFFRAIDDTCTYRGAGVGALHDAAALQHPLADLFGVRFVLTPETLATTPQLVDRTPPGTGGYRLYERTTTLPRASFVQQVDVIADEAARRAALAQRDRDVAHRVVLEDASAPAADTSRPANATVTLVERRDERVVVRVRSDAAGYLRLADPWDSGWRATCDGEATPLYVADHYLRAVHVLAGEHEVVFTYDGPTVVLPLRLTVLAWLTVGVLLVCGRRRNP